MSENILLGKFHVLPLQNILLNSVERDRVAATRQMVRSSTDQDFEIFAYFHVENHFIILRCKVDLKMNSRIYNLWLRRVNPTAVGKLQCFL